MAFPFSVKYSNTLEGDINEDDYPAIFSLISNILIYKPAKNIVVEENALRFKPGSYVWRGNIMATIEKGVFTLIKQGDKYLLTYEFFMYHMIAITFAMGVIFGIISQTILFGVIAFAWLGGMNWIVALGRHKSLLNDITEEINNLIAQKNPQSTIE